MRCCRFLFWLELRLGERLNVNFSQFDLSALKYTYVLEVFFSGRSLLATRYHDSAWLAGRVWRARQLASLDISLGMGTQCGTDHFMFFCAFQLVSCVFSSSSRAESIRLHYSDGTGSIQLDPWAANTAKVLQVPAGSLNSTHRVSCRAEANHLAKGGGRQSH